jgi:hypothetical protein
MINSSRSHSTVVRQNPTDIVGSRTNVVDPSAAVLEEDLTTITIVKTTYTGPWTKRNVQDSTALFNPGGLMIPATETVQGPITTTRETIVASSTTRVLKPSACPHHNMMCEVGKQPTFNLANGRCECDAVPTSTVVVPAPIATPAFLNCPNMPVCTSGTLVWDDVSGACSCA